jgi:hypothetical protein
MLRPTKGFRSRALCTEDCRHPFLLREYETGAGAVLTLFFVNKMDTWPPLNTVSEYAYVIVERTMKGTVPFHAEEVSE